MSDRASYYAQGSGGYFVTEELAGCNEKLPDYPLLPGDWINKRADGKWGKIAPGLGIEGFVLTVEQEATLRPNNRTLTIGVGGMAYFLGGDS